VLLVIGSMIKAFVGLKVALVAAVGATHALKAALISSGIGAAIVVIGSVIASLAVSNSQADAAIRDFNESLRDQNGELKENAELMVIRRLQDLGMMDAVRDLGINQQELARAYIEGGDALQVYIDRADAGQGIISDWSGAIIDLEEELVAQKQGVENAAAATYEYARDADEAAREVNEFRGKVEFARQSLKNNSDTVRDGTDAQNEFNDSIDESINKFLTLNGLLDDNRTVLDYQKSWTDFTTVLGETGVSFDGTTEAGQTFSRALDDVVGNLSEVTQTQENLGKESDIVMSALKNLNSELDLVGMDAATRDQLLEPFQALIDDLFTSGVDVTALQTKIDTLAGKTIEIVVNTTTYGRPAGVSAKEWYGSATGGLIKGRGGPMSDMIPTMLSNGEFVIRSQAVNSFGADFFDALNRGQMPIQNYGAPVTTSAPTGSSRSITIQNLNVVSAAGESAETSVPRSLRRMAWVSGLDG